MEVSPMAGPSRAKNDNSVRIGTPHGSNSRRLGHHPRQIFPPPLASAPATATQIPGEPVQPPPSLSSSLPPSTEAPNTIATEVSSVPSTSVTLPGTQTSSAASTTSRKLGIVSASPFQSSSPISSSTGSPTPNRLVKPTSLLQQPQFIIGVACGGAVLIGIIIGLLVCFIRCRRRRKRKLCISSPIRPSPGYARTFSNTESLSERDFWKLGPLKVTNLAPGDQSASSSRASSVLDMSIGNPNEPGTPRELVAGGRPRFLGVSGRGLSWAGQPGSSWSHQNQAISWPRLPSPGPYSGYFAQPPTPEVWTTGLKRSLSTALNSLKGWVPSSENADPSEPYLTPMPTKQFPGRYPTTSLPTPHGTLSDEYLLGAHMPSHPAVSANPSRSYPITDTERSQAMYSVEPPLIAAMQPLRSMSMRFDVSSRMSYNRGQYCGKIGHNEIHSSASSMYSQSSAPSSYSQPSDQRSLLDKPVNSRQSSQETVRRKPGLTTVVEDEQIQSPSSERPSVISRTSSSGCSVNSYYFSSNASVSTVTGGNGGSAEMDRSAHSALIDRRRKARKVV